MSEASSTWTDDAPNATVAPDGTLAPAGTLVPSETAAANPTLAPSASLAGGRVTVLPRIEHGGRVPQLVSEERSRFEVLDRLGEGGLGEVVAAKDLDIGRKVAIKTIRPDRQSNAAFLRFVQEVRIVGQLDHPNIVPVHDVGRDDGGAYYFVMKCVDGETLEAVIDRLRDGDPKTHAAWTFERRVEVFRQVLQAVHFAHQRGVIHRDIKPANVMIGPFGEVQLLDWGIARPLDAEELPTTEGGPEHDRASLSVTHTRVGALIGTPRYMSPEQARGERVDVRSDVWSLSLLFYELLTLHHPADGLTDLDTVLAKVQSGEVTHPRKLSHPAQAPVPADLGWYVMGGLTPDPRDRFPTVQAMMERMDRRMEGDIPIQCPVTFQKAMIHRTEHAIDRHPFASIFALVGGVVLGGSALVAGVVTLGMGLLGMVGALTAGLLLG
ncbi:MAG: serine/threonine protein kinase [Alphaproteobacteria bacterium]|nr:serine/threonine protein kinase [Alphaproteobacteria bacterium]